MGECLEDKFDILLDYALISETLYNELITKLLNKIKKTKSENPKKGREKENFDLNINSNSKMIEFKINERNTVSKIHMKKQDNLFNSNTANENKNNLLDLDFFNKTDNISDFSYKCNFNFQNDDSDDEECRIILNNQ